MNGLVGKRPLEQAGFASIVIAMVMVLVLSLTTVGFAQLMRREQRSALDKQLTNQAYYAAETGINDAMKALNNGFNLTKSQCKPYSSAQLTAMDTDQRSAASQSLNDNTVGNSTGASYSCLLIDPNPLDLEYSIDANKTRAAEITGALMSDPSQVQTIGAVKISWQDTDNGDKDFAPAAATANHQLATTGDWTYTGMVKVGLTPLSLGAIDRTSLITNTYTAFLYPNASGALIPTLSDAGSGTGSAGGVIVDGNCNKNNLPRYCNVTITGLNSKRYLMTLGALYKGAALTITTYATDGTTQLRIKDAQTMIDSTGKAADILRRVRVRVPTHDDYDLPDGTKGTTICKQLKLTPGNDSPGSPADCPVP